MEIWRKQGRVLVEWLTRHEDWQQAVFRVRLRRGGASTAPK